jgi:hypothetical protein
MLFRWRKAKKMKAQTQQRGDPVGVARAQEELAISEHLASKEEPLRRGLREMRDRNNVTALAREIRRGPGMGRNGDTWDS